MIQSNPPLHALRAQAIWASFEHEDNAPLAAKACDATDGNCYKTIGSGYNKNACPAAETGKRYSYHDPDCTAAGTNVPPKPPADGKRAASDFSFLPGLADRPCTDIEAGAIWNNEDAAKPCPGICEGVELAWNGQWTTTERSTQSVCGCCLTSAD